MLQLIFVKHLNQNDLELILLIILGLLYNLIFGLFSHSDFVFFNFTLDFIWLFMNADTSPSISLVHKKSWWCLKITSFFACAWLNQNQLYKPWWCLQLTNFFACAWFSLNYTVSSQLLFHFLKSAANIEDAFWQGQMINLLVMFKGIKDWLLFTMIFCRVEHNYLLAFVLNEDLCFNVTKICEVTSLAKSFVNTCEGFNLQINRFQDFVLAAHWDVVDLFKINPVFISFDVSVNHLVSIFR